MSNTSMSESVYEPRKCPMDGMQSVCSQTSPLGACESICVEGNDVKGDIFIAPIDQIPPITESMRTKSGSYFVTTDNGVMRGTVTNNASSLFFDARSGAWFGSQI